MRMYLSNIGIMRMEERLQYNLSLVFAMPGRIKGLQFEEIQQICLCVGLPLSYDLRRG